MYACNSYIYTSCARIAYTGTRMHITLCRFSLVLYIQVFQAGFQYFAKGPIPQQMSRFCILAPAGIATTRTSRGPRGRSCISWVKFRQCFVRPLWVFCLPEQEICFQDLSICCNFDMFVNSLKGRVCAILQWNVHHNAHDYRPIPKAQAHRHVENAAIRGIQRRQGRPR